MYTGPGLSIHCMQVHKESIDKVPNALPNRSNIEIEIYGMEGIPADDIKEHERQKGGPSGGGASGAKSDTDEDDGVSSSKKSKSESVAGPSNTPTTQLGVTPTPMTQPNLLVPQQFPGQFPMQFMPPYMQHPGHMPPMMMRPPLFPAGAAAVSSTIVGAPKPTFPAYSAATISAPPTTKNPGNGVSNNSTSTNGSTNTANNTSKSGGGAGGTTTNNNARDADPPPTKINTSSTSTKIIHPSEDLSLEELKARKPLYVQKVRAAQIVAAQSAAAAATSNSSTTVNSVNSTPNSMCTTPVSESYAPITSMPSQTVIKEQPRMMTPQEVSEVTFFTRFCFHCFFFSSVFI